MQYWVNGKICVDDKIKTGEYPFKNQSSSIPLFHYSIFKASVQASKKYPIFSLRCRISETFN
jgi:hypothetical protein